MSDTKQAFRVGPADETEVFLGRPWAEVLGPAIESRGLRRVLVLSSAGRRPPVDAVVEALAERGASVGVFDESAQHVPRALAERAAAVAAEREADAIIAIGGGSVIGLGKAIALLRAQTGANRPLSFIVLPSTYAGSEMTALWGLGRADGDGKEVGRDDRVRADLVIYDPASSASLPGTIAVPSLFNAMAHSVDALYARAAAATSNGELGADDGELDGLAERSVAELARAISAYAERDDAPDHHHHHRDPSAGLDALAGAQKAGELLDRAGTSLQHALAHVLGGSFGLAHAPTHAILLPHVVAFMAGHAPAVTKRLAHALGASDPAAALYDLQRDAGAPVELRELGFGRADIDAAVDRLLDKSIASPRPLAEARPALRELFLDAWLGRRPHTARPGRRLPAPTLTHAAHAGIRPALAGAPLDQASAVALLVHGRGSTAEAMIASFDALLADLPRAGLAIVAVQASARSWYEHGFAEPLPRNQPELDGALELIDATRRAIAAHVDPGKIVLVGFSQGACLVLEHLARVGGPLAGVFAIAGALIGEDPVGDQHRARELAPMPVVVGVAAHDSWVPRARVEATADHLEAHGATVQRCWEPGEAHTITTKQAEALRELIAATSRDHT